MAAETEFAAAKINLCLHVTGQRADGYHLLDSLVCFADIGDRVTVTAGQGLKITGPQAAQLAPMPDNLCLRAAEAMGGGVSIGLEKHLPIASGIGGGSADAAAVLRAMARMGRTLPEPAQVLALGADVPVCLSGRATRMQGVGEVLTPVSLPSAWLVLVNPGVGVSTPEIFRALGRKDNAPLSDLPEWRDCHALADWLAAQRNDLQAPAIALQPVIEDCLAALEAQSGCALARMSGSGATCFGLFKDQAKADTARAALAARHPAWWVAAGQMLS
ncbi:4-(cytidine 5'-diphospho)-2-C-methyl-D-erythritol kinase [Xinfangfangia sp. CPCC 101601]|uniref:4-diphosphocytidyl-2-C-methyl-D-erythritol kinase n=1 Tax=Pseudogemmobacter lacusdianii TaxID=3069608 RepID=A0ABU0VX37_9RHOB|nr:4-(cytidine 5'-diphospho)-2-C-methyl-D-erythritol kinase [Xinfangfangia sp. CPCC 101601]MDQ2066302.1 4-(cytidine 5'-diphospho)-2-C-methyl-D-erythritol kinase [Xinfangfangia sp. CPCC 101601]